MTAMLPSAFRGLVRCLKEATGEARWDDYVAQCHRHGHEPMTRREFERRRADLKERSPQSRCC